MSATHVGRRAIKARQIRPGQAYAVEIGAGQLLQIIDVKGKQVADFVALRAGDADEFVSVAHTRSANANLMLQQGMKLYSNRRLPMFDLTEDSVGRHDMLFAACDPKRYEELEAPGHASCRVALAEALAPYGVTMDRVPDPVNWFMNVAILPNGEFEIREPISERNDYVILTALVDAVVAISACPQDKTPTNGMEPSDILVRVLL